MDSARVDGQGYGLRRVLLDREGNTKGVLKSGEYKHLSTDRVVLVPGPTDEVLVVEEIYQRFIERHDSMPTITKALNQLGIVNEGGGLWTRDMVSGVLTNPKYMGTNVTNRRSFKLKAKSVHNPPEMWIRKEGAFQPLVNAATFKKAQEVLATQNRVHTDAELLELLSQLLRRTGTLSAALIDHAGDMPKSKTYQARFGGLLGAYRRIGYKPRHDYSFLAISKAMQASHKDRLAALVVDFERMGAKVSRDAGTDLLTINDELRLRFLDVRCHPHEGSGYRWFFRFDSKPACDITIAARMSPQNDFVLDYFLVPCFENLGRVIYGGSGVNVLNIYRFGDLSTLEALVRRTRLKEEI